jgi:hypothetical protein
MWHLNVSLCRSVDFKIYNSFLESRIIGITTVIGPELKEVINIVIGEEFLLGE